MLSKNALFSMLVVLVILSCTLVLLIPKQQVGSIDPDESSFDGSSGVSNTSNVSDTSSEISIPVTPSVDPDTSSEVVSGDENSSEDSSNDTSSYIDASSDISSDTSSTTNTGIEEVIDSILIDKNNRAMEIFSYSSKSNGGKNYALRMNALYQDLQTVKPGIKLYSMAVPKPCAYYIGDSEKYSNYAGCTELALKQIDENLDGGIISVDVYNALLPHKNEEIYFRSDYHWTGLGAYYGAEALAKAAGVSFAPLSDYSSETRRGFLGALYSITKSSKLYSNPDSFTVYKNKNYTYNVHYTVTYHDFNDFNSIDRHDIFYTFSDEKNSLWYMTYLNGDDRAVHIKSNVCSNGRKLLIIKDSNGNPLAPYFLESFEDVWMIDIRKFKDNVLDFVKEYDITDVSVSMSIHSVVGSNQKYLDTIRTQAR